MTPPAITLEKEGADKTSLVRMLSSALERKLTGRIESIIIYITVDISSMINDQGMNESFIDKKKLIDISFD